MGLPADIAGARELTLSAALGEGTGEHARLSRRVAVDLIAAGDAIIVIGSGSLLSLLLPDVSPASEHGIAWVQSGFLAALITHVLLQSWGFYRTQRVHALPLMPTAAAAACGLAIVVAYSISVPGNPAALVSAGWHLAWFAGAWCGLMAFRGLLRPILRKAAIDGRFDIRIAVYGGGATALRLRDYLENGPLGYHFAGSFDDRSASRASVVPEASVDGSLEDLIAAGHKGRIDQIIIALPQTADRRIAMIARRLEQLPVSVHVLTHLASDLIDPRPAHAVSTLGPVGLLEVKQPTLTDWAPIIKRGEDLVLGTLFGLIALPICALIAVAIKLDSPGPVLFRQRRRGLGRGEVTVFKFRTMSVLEDDDTVRQATSDDARITRVGRWLRRTSLDELPQLFNVIRGDMSLVGPRPHAIAHDNMWSDQLERYAHRHQVKPGITGLAQVQGYRGLVGDEGAIRARVDNDLRYIETWSLLLDLKIIARTVVALISARNAH